MDALVETAIPAAARFLYNNPIAGHAAGHLFTAGYNVYKHRQGLALAAGMARPFFTRKRKWNRVGGGKNKRRKFNKKRRVAGSSRVIGQYAQRSGRVYGNRRFSGSKRVKAVKSALFSLLPTKSLICTSIRGNPDAGRAIILADSDKQTWRSFGIFGCAGAQTFNSVLTNPDSDLLRLMYASIGGSDNIALSDMNNMQLYVMNAHTTVDVHIDVPEELDIPQVEVTFYVVAPRKSQRTAEKGGTTANFLAKFSKYFSQEQTTVTSTGDNAWNAVQPYTSYGVTPFDSRVFCKEWKVLKSQTILVNDKSSCSFSWGRSKTVKVLGADMDEYDYIRGVYNNILVRFRPFGKNIVTGTNNNIGSWKYRTQYNYKVLESNVATNNEVVGIPIQVQ